jgi:hypothetical protein
MRFLIQFLFGLSTAVIGVSTPAQQAQKLSKPSTAEVLALVDCEDAALGKAKQEQWIRSGVYDVVYGQWLSHGPRRDEVISCLVERHGWAALSAPDGRRGARAPR